MRKLLLSTAIASATLVASNAIAQTTVSGNLDISYKMVGSNTTAATTNSFNGFGKEAQINIQNKGKLNNGMDYAAGFSLEDDGNQAGTYFNENTYINLISGNTTLHIGQDHIQNSDRTLANFVGLIAEDLTNSTGTGLAGDIFLPAVGADPAQAYGVGIIQAIPNIGTFSALYVPSNTAGAAVGGDDVGADSADESAYEIGFVGNLGVTGLTAKAFYNHEDKPEKATSATSGAPGSGTPSRDFTGESFGLQYKVGAVTVGADFAKTEFADNTDVEYTGAGVAYNLSKDVAVSYNYAKAERTGKTADEKIHNLAVGYSLGPVSTSVQYNKISDAGANTGPTAGTDFKYVILKAGTAF